MFNVAEAVVRVFHRFGDYEHPQRNRMKFVVKALGWDGFRARFEECLDEFKKEGGARLPFDPADAPDPRLRPTGRLPKRRHSRPSPRRRARR